MYMLEAILLYLFEVGDSFDERRATEQYCRFTWQQLRELDGGWGRSEITATLEVLMLTCTTCSAQETPAIPPPTITNGLREGSITANFY